MEICAYCDLNVIRQNLLLFKSKGKRLLFMVKANAYGHGIVEVARATEDIVDYFGVATVNEGLKLRKSGIKKPILVSIFFCDDAMYYPAFDLTAAVFKKEHLSALSSEAKRVGVRAKAFVKSDTGMNRLGVKSDGLEKFLSVAKNSTGVDFLGMFSHLRLSNEFQLDLFNAEKQIYKNILGDGIFHILSSKSADLPVDTDMIRVGIGGYGYADGAIPALSVYTKVICSKFAKKGEFVSYGSCRLKKDANLAVVFGGYYDGIKRMGQSIVIGGIRRKVLSVACMDISIVDTGEYVAKVGERACILGEGYTAEDIAKDTDTISYEVLTSLDKSRLKRVYFT